MSNDKNAELDILAEAFLPSDLLTPTLGSNYGMDGYPDMEYNMGVLDAVVNPLLHEAPALPTGIAMTAAAEMDVQSILNGETLADLDWLDPHQGQDEERLPVSPVDLMIPELIEAWGVNRRTDGTHLTAHQTDLTRARYEASLNGTSTGKRINARSMERVLTHAMRQSIEGWHIDRVLREASESVGGEFIRIVPHLRLVKAEHGLVGNVFIRAAAYPGWGAGKGKAHAKKHAKQARYIVVSKHDMDQATWIQNGRCAYTGKIAVTEVPWKKALAFYAPRLEATGRKVASGDPREALRQAFLSQSRKAESDTGYLPTHETPDQRVSREAARATFDAYQPERTVLDPAKREHARRLAKVDTHLARMERDNLLPQGTRENILASGRGPVSMLRAATHIAAQVKEGTYVGDTRALPGQNERWHRESQRVHERQAGADTRLDQTALGRDAQEVRSLVAKVEREVERGARGSYLQNFIAKTIPKHHAKAAIQLLAPTLSNTGFLRDGPVEAKEYDQPVFSRVASTKKARSVLAGQIKQATAWVRRSMTEGFAGKDLDALIQHRFAGTLLQAADSEIKEVRAAQEGLSGFVYVDAGAYASEAGIKGCESGALRHRANQIQNVRAMSRCATCTVARVREDGTRKCGTYNKTLVSAGDVAGPELDSIRQANIGATDMTDAEVTASMFAPTYDPSEFGLHNANLEGITASESSLPETEKLAEILFGGWDL
jgi:hypothetical protein